MARARNIKPGFFRNADLVELSVETRLLFIGLWTLADRDGRLEDRPKQIKMEIFPADSIDCNVALDELAATGMLKRYEVGGKRYLQVVNFTKHQNPHRDEKASTIPDEYGHVAETAQPQAKHRANTVQAPCNDDADTVAIVLNPESRILIPESSTEDTFSGKGVGAALAADTPQPVPLEPEQTPVSPPVTAPAPLPAPPPTAAQQAKATLLPADWQLPKVWGEWALAEYPHWTAGIVRLEADKFVDHWRGKSGKDARKADWLATWRNWCRSDITQRSHPATAPNRAAQPLSFAQQDEQAKRRRWEEMTGRPWPTDDKPDYHVIDITPTARRIA